MCRGSDAPVASALFFVAHTIARVNQDKHSRMPMNASRWHETSEEDNRCGPEHDLNEAAECGAIPADKDILEGDEEKVDGPDLTPTVVHGSP